MGSFPLGPVLAGGPRSLELWVPPIPGPLDSQFALCSHGLAPAAAEVLGHEVQNRPRQHRCHCTPSQQPSPQLPPGGEGEPHPKAGAQSKSSPAAAMAQGCCALGTEMRHYCSRGQKWALSGRAVQPGCAGQRDPGSLCGPPHASLTPGCDVAVGTRGPS